MSHWRARCIMERGKKGEGDNQTFPVSFREKGNHQTRTIHFSFNERGEREPSSARGESRHQQEGRGNDRPQEGSHEQLVAMFKGYVQGYFEGADPAFLKRQQERGTHVLPEELIRDKLLDQTRKWGEIADFWHPVLKAWDALAYERYRPGSVEAYLAKSSLADEHRFTSKTTVKLTNPLQVRTVDALAEAFGIPHERGQEEIEIPEQIRRWSQSSDYQKDQERKAEIFIDMITGVSRKRKP